MLEHERWLALVLLLPTLLSEGVRSSTRDILKNIRSLLMLVLAPLAAMIVQMAISRTREYAADNLGARISGRPDALASALVKISSAAEAVPNDTAEFPRRKRRAANNRHEVAPPHGFPPRAEDCASPLNDTTIPN